MRKPEKTIIRETVYISMWVLIFSMLMQAVYLLISKWEYTVLLGNLLGDCAAILNFFLLGLTVQKAADEDEKKARLTMQFSRIYRLIGMAAIMIIGIFVPIFEKWSVIISAVLFARLAILIRPLFNKRMNTQDTPPYSEYETEVKENIESDESQI